MPALPAPTLSVVLTCKNSGPRLPAALTSLWEQRAVEPEIIVIDRGSTDGTRDWLETQRDRLAHLVSEPDAGIYAALNRGVALARGEWLYFFGADGRLVGDLILSESVNWLNKTEAGVAAGEVAFNDGRIYKLHSHVNPLAHNFVHHRATFYRRSLFAENDGFDPAFALAADYEFNVRLWKNRVRFKPIPLRIAACDTAGPGDSGVWRRYREEIAVRHRYFGVPRCLLWDALSVTRYLRRQLPSGRAR